MSNVAASVRARLLKVAKAQGTDFQQVLIRFGLERILYRLTQSPHADRFLLKRALLFAQAIKATFERRGMAAPAEPPIGLTDEFAHDPSRQALWQAFAKKNDLAPEPLAVIVGRLRTALEPALNRANA